MDIEEYRHIYSVEKLIVKQHAAKRMDERGISVSDVEYTIMHGIIIEDYPDDLPYPSCLVLCAEVNGRPIHIVISSDGELIHLITAYVPDPNKWDDNFSKRRKPL